MISFFERYELEPDAVIMLNNKPCRIINVLGCGTSSIVYKAEMPVCIGGFTCDRAVVLKELYPMGLDIGRKDDMSLDIPEISLMDFRRYTDRFKKACKRQIQFHNYEKTTNVTTDLQDMYEVNNTLYSVMGIVTGNSYDKELHETILSILNVGMCLADCISKYHEMGYLHLDIKPENIFKERLTGENIKIKLFDFDTVSNKKEVLNGEFSYSEGYEAPEVSGSYNELFDFSDIDERADIYSIGAVIFEKIMGRVPDFSDQRNGKIWDFSNNNYLKDTVPQLQKGIMELFRKTLARKKENRYSSADELKNVLKNLINIAGIKVFLKNQRISPCTPKDIYISRKDILSKISKALDENHILYLHAIGGSGKSETAREYAEQYADKYDFIQSVFYSGSLKKTIANLDFVGLKDEDRFAHTDEDIDRLYNYKYGLLGNSDIYKANTLLIIDNYNPTSDEVIQNQEIISRLRDLHIHILFTTRVKPTDTSECFDLENMFPEELRALFFRINPTDKDKSERIKLVDEIIKLSYNHTMTVKLVAMQSAEYMKPLEEYRDVLQEKGLNSGFESEIINEKDGRLVIEDSVYNHIIALFKLNELNPKQKYIMVNACLLPLSGLEAATFSKYIDLAHFESSSGSGFLDPEIKKLVNSGWIEYADTSEKRFTAETKITLHPLICDIVTNELKPELTEDKCRKFYISFLDTIEYWSSNLSNSIFKDIIIAIYNNITKIDAIKTHINYEYLTKSINYLLMSSPGEYIINNYCLILKKYNRLICYYGINDSCKISSDVKSIAKNAFANSHYLMHIEIPNTITVINEGCFDNCTSLVNIVIPDSVYLICDDAFVRCVSLTNVTLSKKLTDIGKRAFCLCKSLSEIIIPENVNTIGAGAFAYCSNLKHVALPEKVINIATGLFKKCISLESIKLSDKILSIYDFAFENCFNLSEINLPDNPKHISENAFDGCSKLKNDTCELLKKWQSPTPKSNITEYSYTISEVTNNIKPKQFYNNIHLKNINITEGVKKIGYSAFEGCSSLTEIHIPNSVKKIEFSAFQNCTNLEKIFLPIRITKISPNLFCGCKSLRYLKIGNQNPTDHILKLPNSIIKIEDHAFQNCQSLTSVFIPDSVKLMGYSVFRDCTSLVSAKLPRHCHVLSDGLFSGCISLEYILLPTDFKVIGHYTFCKCAFTEIELPDSVQSIGEGAFENSHLTDISLPENINFLGQNAFKNCLDLKHITLPDYIESIYDSTFESCTALMNIKLPEKLMKIGKFAFKDCISLQKISIPDRLKIIDDAAFESCKSIQQLFIPCSVLDIGINTFFNCESLNEITFLCAGTSIENSGLGYFKSKTNNLYHKNENLVIKGYKGSKAEQYAVEHGFKFVCIKYEIPDGVIKIKDYLFSGCKSLKKIHIPESVRFIGEYAFSNCDLLDEINIPNSVTSINQFAFFNCQSLKKINIPDNVESIDFMVFKGCVSLEEIRIPNGLIRISPCAFESCFSLTNVIIPPNVKYIGCNAFSYSTLSKITFLNNKAYTASDGIDISESRIGYYESNNKDTCIKKYVKNENLIIEGYKGSTAEQYAQEHGFKFVPLD